jgi:hypothetical protein
MNRTVRACSAIRALLAIASLTGIIPAAQAGIGGSDLLLASRDELSKVATSDLLLLGPVDAVDQSAKQLVVLGQKVVLQGRASPVAVGNIVEVRGSIGTDGTIRATSVSVNNSDFVAGASRFLLTGVVSRADASRGLAQVGGLSVDYTPSLHSFDAAAINVGKRVVLTGIQPIAGKTFVAFSAFAPSQVSGIGGSDRVSKTGIGGSDRVSGIGGSDRALVLKRGIGGSDRVNGIGGSDRTIASKTGIGGSDLLGIGGSDRRASAKIGIGGSDLNGIGGSDRRLTSKTGIGGSDRILGIGGSDRLSVSKTGIGGSDRVLGIGGSDRGLVLKRGIGGSDWVLGIGGSDRASAKAGIGGSDRILGIGGSDRIGLETQGIGGSDIQ